MNKKLRIKLYNEGNVVIYRVLEQCESLRSSDKNLIFRAKEIEIRSTSMPMLDDSTLWIRGEYKFQDTRAGSLVFDDEQSAKEYIEKCLEALKEFADNNYFDGKSDTIEDIDIINDEGVYEF